MTQKHVNNPQYKIDDPAYIDPNYDTKHFRTFQSSAAQGTPCVNVIKFKKLVKIITII